MFHALAEAESFPVNKSEYEWLEGLLEKFPHFIHQQNEDGMTVMHKAAMCGNGCFVEFLKDHGIEPDELSAMLLEPLLNPVTGKYDIAKTRIDQAQLFFRISKYLEQKRKAEPDLYSPIKILGLCRGLSYLFGYYSSREKVREFYEALEEISKWDQSEATLQDVPTSPIVAKVYQTKSEVIEHWINDANFFQSSDLVYSSLWKLAIKYYFEKFIKSGGDHPIQSLLSAKHAVVQKDDHAEPIKDSSISVSSQIGLQKVIEAQNGWMRVLHLNFQTKKLGHTVSIFVSPEGKISFYDAELRYEFPPSTSAEQLSRILMTYFKLRYGAGGSKQPITGAVYNFSI